MRSSVTKDRTGEDYALPTSRLTSQLYRWRNRIFGNERVSAVPSLGLIPTLNSYANCSLRAQCTNDMH